MGLNRESESIKSWYAELEERWSLILETILGKCSVIEREEFANRLYSISCFDSKDDHLRTGQKMKVSEKGDFSFPVGCHPSIVKTSIIIRGFSGDNEERSWIITI
jgi:hypothetical protein